MSRTNRRRYAVEELVAFVQKMRELAGAGEPLEITHKDCDRKKSGFKATFYVADFAGLVVVSSKIGDPDMMGDKWWRWTLDDGVVFAFVRQR
jgi:hypothetical protein